MGRAEEHVSPPKKIWKKYFSGSYHVKFGHFSGKYHVKFVKLVVHGVKKAKLMHIEQQKCKQVKKAEGSPDSSRLIDAKLSSTRMSQFSVNGTLSTDLPENITSIC